MTGLEYHELDPREDLIGLYVWGTVGWFVMLFIGTTILVFLGNAPVG